MKALLNLSPILLCALCASCSSMNPFASWDSVKKDYAAGSTALVAHRGATVYQEGPQGRFPVGRMHYGTPVEILEAGPYFSKVTFGNQKVAYLNTVGIVPTGAKILNKQTTPTEEFVEQEIAPSIPTQTPAVADPSIMLAEKAISESEAAEPEAAIEAEVIETKTDPATQRAYLVTKTPEKEEDTFLGGAFELIKKSLSKAQSTLSDFTPSIQSREKKSATGAPGRRRIHLGSTGLTGSTQRRSVAPAYGRPVDDLAISLRANSQSAPNVAEAGSTSGHLISSLY